MPMNIHIISVYRGKKGNKKTDTGTILLIHYRITAVSKVETEIIASIAASQTGRAVILVIMYVEIFKTGTIFIIDVKMCLMSH